MRLAAKKGQGAGPPRLWQGSGRGGGGRGNGIWVFLATVGGLGYAPLTPGTWGSVVGLVLGVVIAQHVSQPLSWMVLTAGWLVSAAVCTEAERALGRHDPPEVILDEVLGMASVPVLMPHVTAAWPPLVIALALFRVFDITKPFPLKRLAMLPAGWGIVADDLGAAAYACVVLWIVSCVIR